MSSEHQLGFGREHPYNHLIQFGSLITFLIVWSLDSFVFNFFEEFTRFAVFPMRLGLSLLTLFVALYLLKTSHDAVIGAKESKSLVTSGPYAYVRHPMYLGPLLIYLSLIFLTMSLISLIPLIVIFFLYNFLVNDEEKDLERILGQEYVDYKNRVARWIPKIY
jgi:protein-S-isoprenylcysteine O-methyltransferase Ste14